MSIIIGKRYSRDKKKFNYFFAWVKGPGQRVVSGIFTHAKRHTQTEKNHNKEALLILENRRSKLILESQSVGTGYIPLHKIKTNFFDLYANST